MLLFLLLNVILYFCSFAASMDLGGMYGIQGPLVKDKGIEILYSDRYGVDHAGEILHHRSSA